jgi:hypothetical protein
LDTTGILSVIFIMNNKAFALLLRLFGPYYKYS